jgi:hypothetical protein
MQREDVKLPSHVKFKEISKRTVTQISMQLTSAALSHGGTSSPVVTVDTRCDFFFQVQIHICVFHIHTQKCMHICVCMYMCVILWGECWGLNPGPYAHYTITHPQSCPSTPLCVFLIFSEMPCISGAFRIYGRYSELWIPRILTLTIELWEYYRMAQCLRHGCNVGIWALASD